MVNTLATHHALIWFNPKVYCLNPRVISYYKKTFIDIDKADPKDAFVISDFIRVNKITTDPWNGSQYAVNILYCKDLLDVNFI